MEKFNYRLGLDLGSSSIGWAIIKLDENGKVSSLENLGSRIFSDGRDPIKHTPLSVEKQLARGQSVRRTRLVQRKKTVVLSLQQAALMPKEISKMKKLEPLNPYKLRALGVNQKLELYELGRALFHINQRRGFKSNRKADKFADENEKSAMKKTIEKLRQDLAGKTLGEYLYARNQKKETTRMRAELIRNKNSYEIYADREMYEKEFDALWDFQAKFHKELNAENKERVRSAIFYQRPLKATELGKCQFENSEELAYADFTSAENEGIFEKARISSRAYSAYPISQAFRIYSEVNQLEVLDISSDNPLTEDDRKKLIKELLKPSGSVKPDKINLISWKNIIKLLGLPNSTKFNLESDIRKGLQIDTTAKVMNAPDCFNGSWNDYSDEVREAFIFLTFRTDDEEKVANFVRKNFKVSESAIKNIVEKSLDLKEGTGSLSACAMKKIMPFLKEGLIYDKACTAAGYNFNKYGSDEVLKELPYYGAVLRNAVMGKKIGADEKSEPEQYYGKINNPTVHVTLNQLRRVVNKIIEVYGKPAEIVVELARNLPLGEKGLTDLAKTQKKNKDANEIIDGALENLGVAINAKNRMKYRLWEDLNLDPNKRCCPFCGKNSKYYNHPISAAELFTPSFEIEHLLPFSITFDDSRANKVISCIYCNRDKRSRTPHEAFSSEKERWEDITNRALLLHKSKQWRFEENALEQFRKDNKDMIARQLNDTRYMSKVAREYLCCLLPSEKIYTSVGATTAILRGKWKLNEVLQDDTETDAKNRADNRHHAIDAFVLACIDRPLLQKISKYAKICEDAGMDRLLGDIEPPLPNFNREEFKRKVDSIIVSHKPDRGNVANAVAKNKTLGALHKQTAYGRIGGTDDDKLITITSRIPLTNLKFKEDNINQVADAKVRSDLLKKYWELISEKLGEKEWVLALKEYTENTGTRRVRIHLKNREISSLIAIRRNKTEEIYKYMDNAENYCMDIYLQNNEKKWEYEPVTMYDAHKNFKIPRWRIKDPKAKLVMRLFKNDIIAFEENNERKLGRVVLLATQGQIGFVDLCLNKIEGNPDRKKASAFQKLNARKVFIDEIGRVFDHGKAKYSE